MREAFGTVFGTLFGLAWGLASPATFIYLIVQDAPDFNAWNWIIIIPCDVILSGLWPLYWAIFHWL